MDHRRRHKRDPAQRDRRAHARSPEVATMALSLVERDELRTTARALLERSSSPDRVRRVVLEADAIDRDLWAQIVGLGWTSIHIDERLGGGGCGVADLAAV